MDAEIYDFSCFFEKGENARNYVFYNSFRGSRHLKMQQNSIQNQCKIDAKKDMQKVWKMISKCIQMRAEIHSKSTKIPEKRHAKNHTKIWCRKWSQKCDFGCQFDFPGGRREVRRASLRRRRLRHTGFSYLTTPWHRPVSADCSCGATADTLRYWPLKRTIWKQETSRYWWSWQPKPLKYRKERCVPPCSRTISLSLSPPRQHNETGPHGIDFTLILYWILLHF